jgi:hypothetical protein
MVGRLASPVGEVDAGEVAEAFDCLSQPGPGGYSYCPYWEGTGTSELLAAPTATAVTFLAQSPQEVRAGVSFQFDAARAVLDLSKYSNVNLTMPLTQGDKFELFLGRGPDLGCSYVFSSKSATNQYSVDLRQAAWCIPSQCGFDLRATGGLLLAYVPEYSTLEATLTSISFGSTGVASGSASALGAGLGPGGLCWFLVGWNDGTSSWVPGQVSSSSAHVRSHASGNAVAGMAFEIPAGFSLSQYRSIQITADVTVSTEAGSFLVQGVREERGIIWRFAPQTGSYTYVMDLTTPESTFGQPPLTLDEIARFEIVAPTGGSSDLVANVTSIGFVK